MSSSSSGVKRSLVRLHLYGGETHHTPILNPKKITIQNDGSLLFKPVQRESRVTCEHDAELPGAQHLVGQDLVQPADVLHTHTEVTPGAGRSNQEENGGVRVNMQNYLLRWLLCAGL